MPDSLRTFYFLCKECSTPPMTRDAENGYQAREVFRVEGFQIEEVKDGNKLLGLCPRHAEPRRNHSSYFG